LFVGFLVVAVCFIVAENVSQMRLLLEMEETNFIIQKTKKKKKLNH